MHAAYTQYRYKPVFFILVFSHKKKETDQTHQKK